MQMLKICFFPFTFQYITTTTILQTQPCKRGMIILLALLNLPDGRAIIPNSRWRVEEGMLIAEADQDLSVLVK